MHVEMIVLRARVSRLSLPIVISVRTIRRRWNTSSELTQSTYTWPPYSGAPIGRFAGWAMRDGER